MIHLIRIFNSQVCGELCARSVMLWWCDLLCDLQWPWPLKTKYWNICMMSLKYLLKDLKSFDLGARFGCIWFGCKSLYCFFVSEKILDAKRNIHGIEKEKQFTAVEYIHDQVWMKLVLNPCIKYWIKFEYLFQNYRRSNATGLSW